jgi:hypothetical protein
MSSLAVEFSRYASGDLVLLWLRQEIQRLATSDELCFAKRALRVRLVTLADVFHADRTLRDSLASPEERRSPVGDWANAFPTRETTHRVVSVSSG